MEYVSPFCSPGTDQSRSKIKEYSPTKAIGSSNCSKNRSVCCVTCYRRRRRQSDRAWKCAADISKAIRESMKAANVAYTQPSITTGDFVFVFGSLAEVVASRKSKFGYKCFKIRYLSRPPIHKEDWYPAIYVRKNKDGKKMKDGILARLSSHGIPARVNPRLVRQAMRKSVLELWEQLQAAASESRRA